MKRIAYSRAALRTLARMPANTATLIRSKIERYASDPASLANNVKALRGEPGVFRLRVGDRRVLFTDEGEIIAIIRVAPRGSAYESGRSRPMKVQTITTPSGDRLVVLPESEFHALVDAAEDASDRAAVDAFRRKLADGKEDLIPAEVVDRLLAGENRIRVWREHRGLSAAALAEQAGLLEPALSKLETGASEATLDTLRSLAAALNVTLDDLAGA